jgi:hypothetical protein
MVFIIENTNYKILEDYLISINNILKLNFIRYNTGDIIKLPEDTKFIIIVYQIPNIDFSLLKTKIHAFFLNSEQLSRVGLTALISNLINNFYNNNRNILVDKPTLLDFSEGNIQYVHNDPLCNFNTIHLPYLPYEKEIQYIHELIKNTPKLYDIAFIGSSSIKRLRLLDALRISGFSVYRVEEKWGEERDRELAKCRMLINVHCDNDYKMFECIRCDRWLFGGMKVVSETSIEKPYNNPFLHVDDYSNLLIASKQFINSEIPFEIDIKTIEDKRQKVVKFKELLDSL